MNLNIFLLTISIIPIITFIVLLVGKPLASLFPASFQKNAAIYLAPSLGLAVLIIAASYLGRFWSMSQLSNYFWLVFALLLILAVKQNLLKEISKETLLISLLALFCGVSLLIPLLLWGMLNIHNDTFTYLVHSIWLQTHAFNETIIASEVTPFNSQIYIYQTQQLRMGGSYLLGLFQALFHQDWSYNIYPGVIISIITYSGLTIGFSISQIFKKIKTWEIYSLSALPTFTLGGIVFAANYGFLPQILGQTLALVLLISFGFILKKLYNNKLNSKVLMKSALPLAVLLSGITFAYSEFIPFVLLTILASGFVTFFMISRKKKLITLLGVTFGLSVLLLNVEVIRAFNAIRSQSVAIAGTPVPWNLLGFFGHIFGLHGGAWDVFQWAHFSIPFFEPIIFIIIILVVLGFISYKKQWKAILQSEYLPLVVITSIFISGIFVFRFFFSSPFKVGIGQSWSQFKLADWASPFALLLLINALAYLIIKYSKFRKYFWASIMVVCLLAGSYFSYSRMKHTVAYYDTKNLNQYYLDFRNSVNSTCPTGSIYLNFDENDAKFKQVLSMYLKDRDVKSNWLKDDYIYNYLPISLRELQPSPGDCLVERIKANESLSSGSSVGNFKIFISK